MNSGEPMHNDNLNNLLKNGAFRFIDGRIPWFPYTSGQIGPYYVQSVAIEKDGRAYAFAIKSILGLIRSEAGKFDAISGGETRDWDFSNPIAVALEKPHLKIYKDGRALGAEISGKTFVHVSDLNNEGSSVRDYWKPIIEKNGGRISCLVSFVDRMEDGFTMLKNLGMALFSAVRLGENAWMQARNEGYISAKLCEELIARHADRRAWAERALLKHPEYFRKFHSAPETRAKAEKIIAAYPGIRPQLKEIIGNP